MWGKLCFAERGWLQVFNQNAHLYEMEVVLQNLFAVDERGNRNTTCPLSFPRQSHGKEK